MSRSSRFRRRVDYYSARIVGGDENVTVKRDRFVSEGMHEKVVVQNLSANRDVRVQVAYGSDFADVMDAQQGGNGAGRAWTERKARVGHALGTSATVIGAAPS